MKARTTYLLVMALATVTGCAVETGAPQGEASPQSDSPVAAATSDPRSTSETDAAPNRTARTEAANSELYFTGYGHHYDSNPFAGGQKGDEYWTIFVPEGAALDYAEAFVTSNQAGATVTEQTVSGQIATIRVHWWYNMWFDCKYTLQLHLIGASGSYSFSYSHNDSGGDTETAGFAPYSASCIYDPLTRKYDLRLSSQINGLVYAGPAFACE